MAAEGVGGAGTEGAGGQSTSKTMFDAMNSAIKTLGTIETSYDTKAAGSAETLTALMQLQAELSKLGMKMQACTALADKIISTMNQASQKVMQS